MRAQKCIKSGLVELVGWDAVLQRGSNVTAEMQTGRMLTWPPPLVVGGLITPLLIYMPFLYVARSSDV